MIELVLAGIGVLLLVFAAYLDGVNAGKRQAADELVALPEKWRDPRLHYECGVGGICGASSSC